MAAILVGAYFFCGCSGGAIGMGFVLYLVMASIGNALHMSFHVRGFHLEK